MIYTSGGGAIQNLVNSFQLLPYFPWPYFPLLSAYYPRNTLASTNAPYKSNIYERRCTRPIFYCARFCFVSSFSLGHELALRERERETIASER